MIAETFRKMIRQTERGDADAEKQLQAIEGHFVRDQVRMWLAYCNDCESDEGYIW